MLRQTGEQKEAVDHTHAPQSQSCTAGKAARLTQGADARGHESTRGESASD